MNVVVLKHPNQHIALLSFIEELAEIFTELGYSVTVLELFAEDYDGRHKILETFKKNVDFVLSFNGWGLDMNFTAANKIYNIYNIYNLTFVAVLVDHPSCFLDDRLKEKVNHLIVTCVDKSNLKFLSSFYLENQIKMKSFLPQGGTALNNFTFKTFDDYLKERTIPLLFIGSNYQENSYSPKRYWSIYPKDTAQLFDDVVDYLLRHDSLLPVEDVYNYMLQKRGIVLSQLTKSEQIYYYSQLPSVINYIRTYRRYVFLETVGKAGIPLVLHGEGWEKHLSKYKSITLKKPLSYRETLNYLQKTNFYINTTSVTYGTHERVLNSILNGAIAVEPYNDYYKDEGFIDGEDIILYKWSKLDCLMNKLALLLEKPENMWQIAKSAQKKASTKHSWRNRAQEILKLVTTYKTCGHKHH